MFASSECPSSSLTYGHEKPPIIVGLILARNDREITVFGPEGVPITVPEPYETYKRPIGGLSFKDEIPELAQADTSMEGDAIEPRLIVPSTSGRDRTAGVVLAWYDNWVLVARSDDIVVIKKISDGLYKKVLEETKYLNLDELPEAHEVAPDEYEVTPGEYENYKIELAKYIDYIREKYSIIHNPKRSAFKEHEPIGRAVNGLQTFWSLKGIYQLNMNCEKIIKRFKIEYKKYLEASRKWKLELAHKEYFEESQRNKQKFKERRHTLDDFKTATNKSMDKSKLDKNMQLFRQFDWSKCDVDFKALPILHYKKYKEKEDQIFFVLNSLAKFDSKAVAGVCVFLACKAEESIRKMLDVAISCARVYYGDPNRLEKVEYEFWRSIIKILEPVVCTSLCYDYSVEHPYRVYIKYMKVLKGYSQDVIRKLAEGGWSIINETYKTPLSLFYSPTIIARSVWWLLSHRNNEATTECVNDLLDLYNFSDIQNSISTTNNSSSTSLKKDKNSSYVSNKYSTPDFNNVDSCDVRFESIAEKLEPDLEPPRGLLDKNDDVVVEDDEEDEDGQIFEDDDEYDGEGVINDQMEEISNEGLDDGEEYIGVNDYEIGVNKNIRDNENVKGDNNGDGEIEQFDGAKYELECNYNDNNTTISLLFLLLEVDSFINSKPNSNFPSYIHPNAFSCKVLDSEPNL
ncbi:2672_t:CDS:10 [Entrophospora sp. SA101]|nr:2672_t:CDS:10 [Entrophospora sp. SA101]